MDCLCFGKGYQIRCQFLCWGKDHWDYMVYDALDRLIATGPALSPFGDGAEGWLHTKYDIHGRVAYTLWKEGPVGKEEQEDMSRTTPTHISEFRLSGSSVSTVNGVAFSWSNLAEPTSGYHVLTVNYYDDYSYTGAPSPIPASVAEGESAVYYNGTLKPKGLPTGSWTRQLETAGQANGLKSYSLYDGKARPVRVYTTNAANGYTQADTKYDFIGNPLKSITKHKKDAAATVLVLTDALTYTPQSRPLKHTHRINSGTEQLLSLNTYDALGRLTSKKVGGSDLSGAAALQKVDYSYNARGWMAGINDINSLNESGAPLDLFAFHINYAHVADDINGAVVPLYNGNIAETFWRSSSDNMVRKYGYSYDYQNRLLDAWYQRPGTSVPRSDSYSAHYSYDRNGNILTLERNGEQDVANAAIPIDDLLYTYDTGNRLRSVRDYENFSAGYNDAHTSGTQDDFGYDAYGNLALDRDKGITAVAYNHLNLPTKITFATGGKIEYFYGATGVKLKKKVTDGTAITTTEYMDGFQYTDSKLDFFPHAEGYVKAVPSSFGGGTPSYTFKYVFSYTDHLGNIRLKYAQDPSNGNAISILEEDHYYPFGLKHRGYSSSHLVFEKEDDPGTGIILTPVNPFLGDSYKYKFQGQEQQDELGLNWISFKWRNYDPAMGRFFNIDPLTEKYNTWSPYAFSGNRVIDARELEGLEPYVVTGRSFIPNKTVSNPNPLSKTKSFAGDGRSNYQLNTTAYRTEQKVRVDFDNKKATTLSNKASSTTGYDKNGNVTETSKPDKAGPTPTYTMDNSTATVNMEVDASNKLVDGAPAINYEVGVTITQGEDGSFGFEIKGESDGFPAYEFFITNEKDGNSYQIYGSNPNETGDGPFSLFPPMEKNINASGNSTTTKPIEEEENND